MGQRIFSVHDSAAQAYLPPFYMKTAGEAIRAFETTVKDTNSQFNRFPADYTLVELGEFDENTAEIISYPTPKIMQKASAYFTHALPSGSSFIKEKTKSKSKKRK